MRRTFCALDDGKGGFWFGEPNRVGGGKRFALNGNYGAILKVKRMER